MSESILTAKALRKRLPAANELVYDNNNFFVIGYSSTRLHRLQCRRSERSGLGVLLRRHAARSA